MTTRTLLLLLATGALLTPLAVSPVGTSAGSTSPDLEVREFIVSRLPFPPYKFLITVKVCNIGTENVAAQVPVMRWYVQAMPGPLRFGSTGPVQDFNVLVHEFPLNVGDCHITRTTWGDPTVLGEYEFSFRLDTPRDSNLANNVAAKRVAFPEALLGSGLGGTDFLPQEQREIF